MNYLAILVAAIATMVLGFLWYGPLFGKPWMKLAGLTTEKISEMKKKGMTKTYMVSMLASLIMAYVLSFFVSSVGADTAVAGTVVGLWVWVGFVATTMINDVLFLNKSVNLYSINTGYQLVSLLIMGAILGVWK